MRTPITVFPRQYHSWIIASFKSSASGLFRDFSKVQRLIASAYKQANRRQLEFEVSRISIQADPTTLPEYTQTEFLFDRRVGASYADNRFFCGAPLRTEAHIELLQNIESLWE